MKLETVVDSGDAESVVPVQMAPWVPRQESEGSKRGQTYLSASGEKLPNMGDKKFDMVTSEGNWAGDLPSCGGDKTTLLSVQDVRQRKSGGV